MTLQHVDILFQIIAFIFAISVHESSHAWMANLRGDPTARMLGRITLNPIKHIDPFGTILLPLVAVLAHIPMLGWAKPTPVDPRNFRRPMLDDILTAVVGPISNFAVVAVVAVLLGIIALFSQLGRAIIHYLPQVYPNHLDFLAMQTNSILMPTTLFLYEVAMINIVLAVFNLIPVPPLDGSHVLRHFIPPNMQRAYDIIGWVGLLALVYLGGGILGRIIFPAIDVFNSVLVRL
ncbi:MAG TPA: site-2 protease family protein [Terriglobales bacterium]|jgi:Zn-dependent protease